MPLVLCEKSDKKGPSQSVREVPPDGLGGTPGEDVAMSHWEGFKFLAGINHDTPLVFMHHIKIIYDMLITCKELHWAWQHGLNMICKCD